MTVNLERPMPTTPADWIPGPGQGNWTYASYATLPEDGRRYEVVDGVLLYMSPSPSDAHQNVSIWLSHYLVIHVKLAGVGQVRTAPLDVELAPRTIVQPDIMVILNEHLSRITSTRIKGAPDLVVEILSPGTAAYDRCGKQRAYAQANVMEYWLVDPDEGTIEVLNLVGKTYQQTGSFHGDDTLISQVVPMIAEVPVKQFFM
jgi:Uma2 family endonuclease